MAGFFQKIVKFVKNPVGAGVVVVVVYAAYQLVAGYFKEVQEVAILSVTPNPIAYGKQAKVVVWIKLEDTTSRKQTGTLDLVDSDPFNDTIANDRTYTVKANHRTTKRTVAIRCTDVGALTGGKSGDDVDNDDDSPGELRTYELFARAGGEDSAIYSVSCAPSEDG